MQLYPHQRDAVVWLTSRPRAGFFDDQGLGKTCTALVAADLVGKRILAVTPTVVVHNWAREARQWINAETAVLASGTSVVDSRSTFVSMTHGMLLNPSILEQVATFAPDVVILDEAHMLRGHAAKKARAFYEKVAPNAAYVWALTGTPQPGWPSDLWRMCSGLWPEAFPETFRQFRSRYCTLVVSEYGDGWRAVGGQNLGELTQRLQGRTLRRKKTDVLDLPPLRHEELVIGDATEVRRAMAELDNPQFEALERLIAEQRFDDALSLLLANADSLAEFRRWCGEAKAPLVADLVEQELEHTQGKQVIFCNHKSVAAELCARLTRFRPVRITGDTTAAQRQEAVDQFQHGASRVAVCQIVAGGTGVTLTASDDVIFAESRDPWRDGAGPRSDLPHRADQALPHSFRFVGRIGR